MSSKIENITKVDSVPHVDLVISDPTGALLAITGGESMLLPSLLNIERLDSNSGVVEKEANSIYPGQSVFSVPRIFVQSICGALTWLPWNERLTFVHAIPSDSVFHFVITY